MNRNENNSNENDSSSNIVSGSDQTKVPTEAESPAHPTTPPVEIKPEAAESADVDPADVDSADVEIDGLKFPGKSYRLLFPHQQVGVTWLWELHKQGVGGIMADEMGLGKTVQVASFLNALQYTGLYEPSIVVCPATLLSQWERELRTWAPGLVPFVLHDSADNSKVKAKSKAKPKLKSKSTSDSEDSFSLGSEDFDSDSEEEYRKWKSRSQKNKKSQTKSQNSQTRSQNQQNNRDSSSFTSSFPSSSSPSFPSSSFSSSSFPSSSSPSASMSKSSLKWIHLINRMKESKFSILLTTYEQLRICRELLLTLPWDYAILDEGHKIRNPEIETTSVCKSLRTRYRLILTGSPIQNRLSELWSLFDFIYPGRLGTLPVFLSQFDVQISMGGYSNASPLQVATAYKCSLILRDLILPFILRRMKNEVETNLPEKTEQVLFCCLTPEQRHSYLSFLNSADVDQIFEGKKNLLFGIDVLRKVCNHPDLLIRETSWKHPDYGNPMRSGKMMVLLQLLELWHQQKHKVLIFTQTQQMLDILESSMSSFAYVYRRMDGRTPVSQRMRLIDEFNDRKSNVFVFILTTRVGGLGTNLIGANRVVIFDPDWNPSTDAQARERAWRIGQKRKVTIYRLITKHTMEEKIYQKQIYKQALTNRVLTNPLQRRLRFKLNDMRDLLSPPGTETDEKSETVRTLFGSDTCSVSVNFRNRDEREGEGKGEGEGGGEGEGEEGGEGFASSSFSKLSVKEFAKGRGVESWMEEGEGEERRGGGEGEGESENDEGREEENNEFLNLHSFDRGKRGRKRKEKEKDDELRKKKKKRNDMSKVNRDGDGDDDENEKNILENLFASNGIFSAINQNAIENLCEKEKISVDFEATKNAQQALQMLRNSYSNSNVRFGNSNSRFGNSNFRFGNSKSKSTLRFGKVQTDYTLKPSASTSDFVNTDRDQRLKSFTLPKSTGSGSVWGLGFEPTAAGMGIGLPKVRGISSSELIANLKRQELESENDTEVRSEPDHGFGSEASSVSAVLTVVKAAGAKIELDSSDRSLLSDVICQYLKFNGGSVSSKAVVREFAKLLSHAEMKLFASTLKQVARLVDAGSEQKVWELNSSDT